MKSGIRNGIQQAESAIFGILHKFMQNELSVAYCHRMFWSQPYRLRRMDGYIITQGDALRYICLSHSGSPSLKSFSFSPAVTTKRSMSGPKGHNIFSPGQRPMVQTATPPRRSPKGHNIFSPGQRPAVQMGTPPHHSPKGHNIFSPGQRPAVQRAPHLPNTACKAATDIAQWKRPVVHGKRPVEYDA